MARRRLQITTLGILLDPIADKLLISAAFVSLVDMQLVPAWMVVIIIGREFTVLGLRNIALAEGFTIEASVLGKTKMVLQVCAVAVVIAGSAARLPEAAGAAAAVAGGGQRADLSGAIFSALLGTRGRSHQAAAAVEHAGKPEEVPGCRTSLKYDRQKLLELARKEL